MARKAGVTIIRNPQLTPYLGPHIFFPPDLKESKRDNFEHETITILIRQLPPAKVWATALQPGLKQAGLLKHEGFDLNIRQTFLMDLAGQDEAALFNRLHEDFRRNLRKTSVTITITDEPEALRDLYTYQEATLQRKGLKMQCTFPYMQRLFAACAAMGQTALWVARSEDKTQAILWHMWDAQRAYYLVGSKNPEVKNNSAMTALIWHAITHSKKLGKITFDFEGSMAPGIEAFFRHFGARRELYFSLLRNESLRWKMVKLLRRG